MEANKKSFYLRPTCDYLTQKELSDDTVYEVGLDVINKMSQLAIQLSTEGEITSVANHLSSLEKYILEGSDVEMKETLEKLTSDNAGRTLLYNNISVCMHEKSQDDNSVKAYDNAMNEYSKLLAFNKIDFPEGITTKMPKTY